MGVLPVLGSATGPAAAADADQTWEIGVVDHVSDGDTVAVDVTWAADAAEIAPPLPADPLATAPRTYCNDRLDADGTLPDDGSLDRCRVRLIGVQAPEVAGKGGSAFAQCKADAATAALKAKLPAGTPVQLRSRAATSREYDYSGGRLVRSIYYKDASGQWVDAARAVLAGGHALWFPFQVDDPEKPEYGHNLEYRRLVDAAAAAHRGLWSDGYCGPTTRARLSAWVVGDPPGDDAGNEYAVLRNDGDTPLDVSGWTVRDTSLIHTALPAGTVIAPHDFIRVWSGRGNAHSPTARDFYFGSAGQMFANPVPGGPFGGDGLYVFDVQPGYAYGNLQAWFHYPCDPARCTDPLEGKVRFGAVQYDPPGADTAAGEYVELVNATSAPLSLGGYALARRSVMNPLPPTTTIAAKGTLRIVVGTGTDAPGVVHLGRSANLLTNSGDLLALVNMTQAPVDCRAWGSYSCGSMPVSGPLVRPGATTPPPTTTTPPPPAKASRPTAPATVTVAQSGRRLVVRWKAPEANGSGAVTRYRARAYTKSGTTLKWRATCRAAGSSLTCTTKKLVRGRTYLVKVRARNADGYGPASAPVTLRLR